jgi:cell division protein FtsX
MDTLIHADIFFFVTTIAVVVVTLLLAIVLIYLIKVLNRIKDIAEQVREETILFREDIHELRDSVKNETFKLKNLFSIVQRFIPFMSKQKEKSNSKKSK